MKRRDYLEIAACLRGERVLYHYYPDRYAFVLLSWASKNGVDLNRLRASPYAALLQKPAVRELLANCGGAHVDHTVFDDHWPRDTRNFVLGLDHWSHLQTSRSDGQSYNLVLQLNFTQQHIQDVRARFGTSDLFNYAFHPVQIGGEKETRETLAWARIDMDLASDEALIEEIQSDWMASLHWASRNGWWLDGQKIEKEVFALYSQECLGWLRAQWSEAMLAAALEFLRFEIGISKIFFHTWEGGNIVKGMQDSLPPRSLYTSLPKRFCLTRSTQAPEFLLEDRRLRRLFRARRDIEFYHLAA